ncbi:MAG: flagellar motor switch protein FliM [Pseudomonadota bacterium]
MADNELLSQDEIDALLSGVDSGEVETDIDEPAGEEETHSYDFASQDRIVRGRMPTLETINERFARNFRQSIFDLLHIAPEVTADGVQLTKLSEYVNTLLVPTNLNIIRVKPLRGSGLIVCEPKLIFAVVERFFGGSGRYDRKVEGQEFTDAELRIVRKILDAAFKDLKKAWSLVLDVDFEYVNSEVNPQFTNIVTPTEVTVVSTFNIDLESNSGRMQLVLPYSMVEPIKGLLDSGIQGDTQDKDERWCQSLHEEIKSAEVSITPTLTSHTSTLSEVLEFKPGYVFPIDMPETLLARVEDVPVFRAAYGVSRGNLALKVIEPLNHSELSPVNSSLSIGISK